MDFIVIIIQLILPFLILAVALVVGKTLENKHYASIHEREKTWLKIPTVTQKRLYDGRPVAQATLALGSVVISVDHFKRFLMGFRTIFGGEVRSYSTLLDRGRREAILRMKESCPNADLYLNCRLETSTISNGRGKSIGCVEVTAYSTAITFKK